MCQRTCITFSEKLTDLCFADKVFFANSGAEANEAALKLARRYAKDNTLKRKVKLSLFIKVSMDVLYRDGGRTKAYSDGSAQTGYVTHLPYNDIGSRLISQIKLVPL